MKDENNSFVNHLKKTFGLKKKKKEKVDTNPVTVERISHPDNQQITTIAELRAINNKLLIIIGGVIIVSLIAIIFAWNRANKVDNSRELLYVQMWGDGSYRVLDALPNDDQIVNARLIDSLLEKYIKYRYGLVPQTAVTDFGDAIVFMSEPVYADFKSEQGFNVGKVVSELSPKSNIVEVVWRGTPDHYDAILGTYNNKKTEILRSNIYVTRIEKNIQGQELKREYLIVRLQWLLTDKDELRKFTADELRVNPIGLTILSGELIYDNVPLSEQQKLAELQKNK